MSPLDNAPNSEAHVRVESEETSPASFLDLAPELRNSIYEYVASDPGTIFIHDGSILPHALARTCRRTRQEFLPVLEASKSDANVNIKARDLNFDLGKLRQKTISIFKRRGLNAKNCNLFVEIAITNTEEMMKHDRDLRHWHRQGWRYAMLGDEVLAGLKSVFKICIAYASLGPQGIDRLARLLSDLLTYSRKDRPGVRRKSSPDPLQSRLISKLERQGIPQWSRLWY